MSDPGKLIVFEGVDGSGKSTQIRLAVENIGSDEAIATCEPGGTMFGVALRTALLSNRAITTATPLAELLLYAADRAQHVEKILKPFLARGYIVLCDRYTYSTAAYQGYGRGTPLWLVNKINNIATGGLEADLTIWLDVDAEVGLERTRSRGAVDQIEQLDLEFHGRVQAGYTQIYENVVKKYPECIVRVDASQSAEAVQLEVLAGIYRFLANGN